MGCGTSTETKDSHRKPKLGPLTVAWKPKKAAETNQNHRVPVTDEPDLPVPSPGLQPPPDLPGPTGDTFINEALWLHNAYRARHHAPALRYSQDLTEYAKYWAYTLAKNDWFEHSTGVLDSNRIGENIFLKLPQENMDVKAKDVCDAWYHEIEHHDFSSPDFVFKSGHFTQMVWYETQEFGIAKVKVDGGKCFVVANYRPAGNVQGEFLRNVFEEDMYG